MTRRRHLRWTPDEDEVLLRHIEKNPHNIMAACRAADVELGRGANACKTRFNYLRDKQPQPWFVTVGRKKAVPNRKVVKMGCPITPKPVKKSIWKTIISFFGFGK